MLPELDLRRLEARPQHLLARESERLRAREREHVSARHPPEFPRVDGLLRRQRPGPRVVSARSAPEFLIRSLELGVAQMPVADLLMSDVQRVREECDVFLVKLLLPIPDGHQFGATVGGRRTGRLTGLRGRGSEDRPTVRAVEYEIAKHRQTDAVPKRRQVNLGELERGRELLQELPDAVEEKQEQRTLKRKEGEAGKVCALSNIIRNPLKNDLLCLKQSLFATCLA